MLQLIRDPPLHMDQSGYSCSGDFDAERGRHFKILFGKGISRCPVFGEMGLRSGIIQGQDPVHRDKVTRRAQTVAWQGSRLLARAHAPMEVFGNGAFGPVPIRKTADDAQKLQFERVHRVPIIGNNVGDFTVRDVASFLNPLLRGTSDRYHLRNERTGSVVADVLTTAFDSKTRRTGLLRHASLPEGSALIIAPSNAIHTFFMQFAIDVAFVAKDGRILKTRAALRPWRVAMALRAFAVVELPAGALAQHNTRGGDRFVVETL